MKRSTGLVAALTLFLAVSSCLSADEKGATELEGTWSLTSREFMGKKASAEEIKKLNTRIIIKGDKITVRSLDAGEDVVLSEITFGHDPKKAPKELNLTVTAGPTKGKKGSAIYEIDGDTLKVCLSFDEEKRPTKFAAPNDSECLLLIYKRDKK